MLIKVWSDYKNNAKKKFARINRAASGTGGGPALHLSLTDLESRVIQIIGVQSAIGIAVEEAGFPLVSNILYHFLYKNIKDRIKLFCHFRIMMIWLLKLKPMNQKSVWK